MAPSIRWGRSAAIPKIEFDFKNATPTLTVGSVVYYTSSSNATPQLLTSPPGISGNDFNSNCCANVVVSTVGNLVLSAGSNINNGTSSTPFGNVVSAATGNFTNDARPYRGFGSKRQLANLFCSPFSDVFGGLNRQPNRSLGHDLQRDRHLDVRQPLPLRLSAGNHRHLGQPHQDLRPGRRVPRGRRLHDQRPATPRPLRRVPWGHRERGLQRHPEHYFAGLLR